MSSRFHASPDRPHRGIAFALHTQATRRTVLIAASEGTYVSSRARDAHVEDAYCEKGFTMWSLATLALVIWFSAVGAASAAEPLASPSRSTAAEDSSASLTLLRGTWFSRTELFFGSLK